MVLNGRVKIGISYDEHHNLDFNFINIESDLVESMSICVFNKDNLLNKDFSILKFEFPNLKTILVDPFVINDDRDFANSYGDVEEVILKIREDLPDINIYVQLFKHFLSKSSSIREFYLDAIENLIFVRDSWYYNKKGFFVHIENQVEDKKIRILQNGKILNDLSKISLSWEDIENELIDFKDYFKF